MRSHKGPNVTTTERDLVIKWTKRCLRELAKKEYELVDFHLRPQTAASLQATLMVNIKARKQRSNGGRNQIPIDVRDVRGVQSLRQRPSHWRHCDLRSRAGHRYHRGARSSSPYSVPLRALHSLAEEVLSQAARPRVSRHLSDLTIQSGEPVH